MSNRTETPNEVTTRDNPVSTSSYVPPGLRNQSNNRTRDSPFDNQSKQPNQSRYNTSNRDYNNSNRNLDRRESTGGLNPTNSRWTEFSNRKSEDNVPHRRTSDNHRPSYNEPNPFEDTDAEVHAPGVNFDKYDDIPVEATGANCPAPLESFEDCNLISLVKRNITLAKYTKPTPVQRYSVPIILENRDLMACAQTGSGKTAAFLLPIISTLSSRLNENDNNRGRGSIARPSALVLAPVRELCQQIHKEAVKFGYQSGLRCVAVNGGSDLYVQYRELERGCDVLVATPGRLVDLIERRKISLERIQFLVLDEADRMLDMGFEPAIRRLVDDEGMPGFEHRQTMLFSATFPVLIQRLAADFMNDYVFLRVGRIGSTMDFIIQKLICTTEDDKRQTLVDLLNAVKGLTLIFVETKRSADELDRFLYQKGLPASSIHGDRSQKEREEALQDFKDGRLPILVATDVAARGLDISNVLHVINYDLPNNIESYIHRIGRTGRAGNSGLATALITGQESDGILRDLMTHLKDQKQEIPEWFTTMLSSSNRSYRGSSYGNKRGGSRGGNYNSPGSSRFGGADYRQNPSSKYRGGNSSSMAPWNPSSGSYGGAY